VVALDELDRHQPYDVILIVMASLMSKLADAAGEVSTGVAAAADEVERSAQTYGESDQVARDNLPHVN
jgi:hypothetical protein